SVTESREFSVLRPRIPVKLAMFYEFRAQFSGIFVSPTINSARIGTFPLNSMDTPCGIAVSNHKFRKNQRFFIEFHGHTLRNCRLQP
ncbi:MAG: hypothetical protein MJ153_08175, partial [Clostridia bacterium]|nr:hypothetical protein [Clostridia bacterium]